jgi:Family of unknown function (DUF6298)/Cellulase (glycosyl hydrolase family 5)
MLRTAHRNLMRAAACLLVLGTCSPAQSSGTASAECAELLRNVGPSELASFVTPELDLTPAARRESGKRMGPLTVSTVNPRYFSDPSGRAVYLTGAHTWNNLVDMDSRFPPRSFNFDAYLDFLKAHNHNLIRLWAWEVTRPNDESDTPLRKIASPQPWQRTGPGMDVTGMPKFDLTKLDPSYFQRLRTRVEAARDRGLYVIVMLFEGWSVQFSPGRLSHPFYGANNINETQYLVDVQDIYTLRHPQITQLQKRYVQAVLDTVNDLDNVLFEIANEAGAYSTDWQYAMLRFVKCYESTKPNQHPVGMTYQYPGGTNSTLFNSEADWIAPGPESGNYLSRPEMAKGAKVVISDSDHLEGSSLSDPQWAYKSFFQGLNTLYMDRYTGPDALNQDQDPFAPEIRAAMGQVRLIANILDVGDMVPAPDLATTGYALRGKSGILVLAPDATRFNVDLKALPGQIRCEWFDIVTGRVSDGCTITGGTTALVRSPSRSGAILYLRPAVLSGLSLAAIDNQAQSIRQASMRYAPWLIRLRLIAKPYLDRLVDSYRNLVLSLFMCVAGGIAIGFAGGRIFASNSSLIP